MPPVEKHTDPAAAARASLQLAFTIMGQIGLLTAVAVIGSLALGLWLDRALETRPLFTILLLVGSFPVSMYIIYRIALRAVTKLHSPAAAGQQPKEEMTRDDNTRA